MLGMKPSIGWFVFLYCHLYHHGAKKLTSSGNLLFRTKSKIILSPTSKALFLEQPYAVNSKRGKKV